jgi:hypothetical protein
MDSWRLKQEVVGENRGWNQFDKSVTPTVIKFVYSVDILQYTASFFYGQTVQYSTSYFLEGHTEQTCRK